MEIVKSHDRPRPELTWQLLEAEEIQRKLLSCDLPRKIRDIYGMKMSVYKTNNK